MNAVIKAITPNSPASRTIIAVGDILRKVNGHVISDVLDYKYYAYNSGLRLELIDADGKIKLVRLNKPEGADLGLDFETFLMDRERSCANKCVFCFIDQLPRGMRDTLYYKDDDVRLSFLQGNYITLTNLSKRETERIIKLRISPINISVHTLNPGLRDYMLGSKRGGESLRALYAFAEAGLTLNCQIVVCPGINSGAELTRTMTGLAGLYPSVNSVSVVPVGLTRYREGLTPLRSFSRETALETITRVNAFGIRCLRKYGTRLFYCADELFIKTGFSYLPPDEYYEGYPQLENGVGMLRLMITEFNDEMVRLKEPPTRPVPVSIATGVAAGKYLTKVLKNAAEKYGKIEWNVYTVGNGFFGERVTAAGLITGGDIIKTLKGRELGERLLIPVNMLRSGGDVFLDDLTVEQLSESLGIPVRVVAQDGADLLRAFLGG